MRAVDCRIASPRPLDAAFALALVLGVGGCEVEPDPEPEPEGPVLGEPLGLVLPRASITAAEVGVIVNTDDPLSAQIAEYYLEARGIPFENLLALPLGTGTTLTAEEFVTVEAAVDIAFGDDIQALALTSMRPERVDCMGASAAFGLGFDLQYCQPGPPCNPTAMVDYYRSETTRPWEDYGVRPAMILAAETLEDAQALIDRGVASDATLPGGSGWLVRTTDEARSVRFPDFEAAASAWGEALDVTYLDNSDGSGSNVIRDEEDVLFYFTGLVDVPDIDTNTYLPGAVADHLTSFGGSLPTSGQMTILRWLQAGATASYGTAIEPCNYTTKFPEVSSFLPAWFGGATVVEAYWKSVWMPGEGNFVGEPLSRPFGGAQTVWDEATGIWSISLTQLKPGARYLLQTGASQDGPWEDLDEVEAPPAWSYVLIEVPDAEVVWYRLLED